MFDRTKLPSQLILPSVLFTSSYPVGEWAESERWQAREASLRGRLTRTPEAFSSHRGASMARSRRSLRAVASLSVLALSIGAPAFADGGSSGGSSGGGGHKHHGG